MIEGPRTLEEARIRFPSEEACQQYLFAVRWPKGFVCPRCRSKRAWAMGRGLWLCQRCRYQSSVTAGTLFQDTHLSLTTWFQAICYVTGQKKGVSIRQLQRELGLGSRKTAMITLEKMLEPMERVGRGRLRGDVEVDLVGFRWKFDDPPSAFRIVEVWMIIAAERDGKRIGRIRVRRIGDASTEWVHSQSVPGPKRGRRRESECVHEQTRKWEFKGPEWEIRKFLIEALDGGTNVFSSTLRGRFAENVEFITCPIVGGRSLPRTHWIARLLDWRGRSDKRCGGWPRKLDSVLQAVEGRFNRRVLARRGELFYRVVRRFVRTKPLPFRPDVYGDRQLKDGEILWLV